MDLLTGSLPNGSLRFEPSQKATARRFRGRASVSLPGSCGYLAERLAEAVRFRDRLRSQGPTKAQLAQEHLAFIRSSALACTSKKDLLAQMRRYASDEVSMTLSANSLSCSRVTSSSPPAFVTPGRSAHSCAGASANSDPEPYHADQTHLRPEL
ncbi:hypothetical protein [Microvirga massiliensis]|uniref:hypothetical protein n=1 Tax=Microvirga massiliensis TaxID=1033741 RepID=UPI00062BAE8C|nr:hypothetical protein [Microvirga massiliensis]